MATNLSNPAASSGAAKSVLVQKEGYVVGSPKALLRAEGGLVLIAASMLYAQLGASWWMFVALFLVPDLSMLGYLKGPRLGAIVYNFGHSYLSAAVLAAIGLFGSSNTTIAMAVIWGAHIGFDRLVGYGLKYRTAFSHTHLGQARTTGF